MVNGRADKIWEERIPLLEELINKFKKENIDSIIYVNALRGHKYLSDLDADFWVAYYPEENKIPTHWYAGTNQEGAKNKDYVKKIIGWQFSENGAKKSEIDLKVDLSIVKNKFFLKFIEKNN